MSLVFAARPALSLDGLWSWQPEKAGARARTMPVPGIWNMWEPDWHGPATYGRSLRAPESWRGQRIFLVFEGANYRAEVSLDGRPVGRHEGGYTAFEFEVTSRMRWGQDQDLAVRIVHSPRGQDIEGTRLEQVPCSKETWYYQYAGLWGSVRLEARPAAHVTDLFAAPSLARRRLTAQLCASAPGTAAVSGAWTLFDPAGRRVGEGELTVRPDRGNARAGRRLARWSLVLDRVQAWSPESPRLYRLEAALSTGDSVSTRFGFRDFQATPRGFWLNGRPFYPKGVLLQPNYPETLIMPRDQAAIRQELERVKEGGFNLVRAHIKPMAPAALDLADEMGLLVYAESALAWIHVHPGLLAQARAEMAALVRRDRNHACVVLWGILNENRQAAKKIARPVMRAVRDLDPTRAVIGDSGAVAIAASAGWVAETLVLPVGRTRPEPLEDIHIYMRGPVPGRVFDFFRHAGRPERMPNPVEFNLNDPAMIDAWNRRLARRRPRVFLSEYGFGGLMDFDAALRKFTVTRGQDAVQYREFRDSLARGFRERELGRFLGSVPELVRQGQLLQAAACRRQTEAARLNPNLTGYVLTQFNDVSWEASAGVVDVWRQPKPALAAMREANAPVIGVFQPRARNLNPGQSIAGRLWLVDDAADPAGLSWHLALRGPDGRLVAEKSGRTSGGTRVQPAWSGALGAAQGLGAWRVDIQVARRGHVLFAGHTHLRAFEPAPAIAPTPGPVAEAGPWRVVSRPGDLGSPEWRDLMAAVKRGGRLLVLNMDRPTGRRLSGEKAVPWTWECHQGIGCFVGLFHYLRPGPLFADLPAGLVAGDDYAEVLPLWSLREIPGGRVLAGALNYGTFTVPGDEIHTHGNIQWFADAVDLEWGKGKVRLCQFQFPAADPVARLLWRNTLSSEI